MSRRAVLRSALIWGGLAVSALFAYLAVKDVRFADVGHALRHSNYWWLIPSLAVLAVGVVLRTLRWQFLFLRATRPAFSASAHAMIVGLFFNSILPARAGEAARIVALNQRAGTSRAETTATVLTERAEDVLSLLVLLFVFLPWFPHVRGLRAAAIVGIVLVLALAAVVLTLARHGARPLRFLLRPLSRLPLVSGARLDAAAENLAQGLAALRQPRLALASLALTLVSWLVLAASIWLALLCFHLDVSPLASLLVLITANLAMVLPSSPGAVGVFEAATVYALNAYGISDARALSAAVVIHVLNLVPYLVVGFLVLQSHASALRRPGAEHVERLS